MADDLEAIRRKRLEQLRQQQQAGQQMGSDMEAAYQQEQAKAEMEAQRQAILRQILTPEARERLTTIKMSRKELAEQLEAQLIMLAQSGQLRSKIDDEKLKLLLSKMQPKKRQMNITRV